MPGWSIFITPKHVPWPFRLSSRLLLRVRFSYSSAVYPFGEWARPFFMLALYGTYKIHDKGLKSAGAEGAYCEGGSAPQLRSAFSPHEFG